MGSLHRKRLGNNHMLLARFKGSLVGGMVSGIGSRKEGDVCLAIVKYLVMALIWRANHMHSGLMA